MRISDWSSDVCSSIFAWLLNVRGGDVVHSPLPLSFALLHADGGVEWFVDPDKLTPEVTAGLGNAVSVEPTASVAAGLDRLGKAGAKGQDAPTAAAGWVGQGERRGGVCEGGDSTEVH